MRDRQTTTDKDTTMNDPDISTIRRALAHYQSEIVALADSDARHAELKAIADANRAIGEVRHSGEAITRRAGYSVERWGSHGWRLNAPDGASLQIDGHGGIAPTRWECVTEALRRIAQDERLARATS
jgi:hypothetical protein